MGDEALEQRLESQGTRLAAIDRQHGGAEAVLEERAVLVEVVQDHAGDRVALGLHHRADAFAARLVAQIADPLELLVLDQVGDGLDGAGLVDLIRHFRDHDRVASRLLVGLDLHLGSQPQDRAAGLVERADGAEAHEQAARREIGALDSAGKRSAELGVEQVAQGRVRMIDQVDGARDHLAEVVRRDVRRHADRDSRRAVDEQVGEPRRKHQRLGRRVVEVGSEIDGLLVDVGEHLLGELGEPCLGVPVGRRGIAVDGAEVALPVDERGAHVPFLREADEGVVDGGVAVRVVLLEDLADRTGAFGIPPVVQHALLEHRVQDSSMDRF